MQAIKLIMNHPYSNTGYEVINGYINNGFVFDLQSDKRYPIVYKSGNEIKLKLEHPTDCTEGKYGSYNKHQKIECDQCQDCVKLLTNNCDVCRRNSNISHSDMIVDFYEEVSC